MLSVSFLGSARENLKESFPTFELPTGIAVRFGSRNSHSSFTLPLALWLVA
jgi:hypothetical protein